MRAISLLSSVLIAVGLGACTSRTVPQTPNQAPKTMAGNAAAQAVNPPPFVTIRRLSWAGSGCPAGSVAGNLAPDLQAFTLLFDRYVAELGPGLPLSLSRRNCQILVDLEFPQGWSFSVFDVDYRGFANLEAGTSGVQQSSYFFQGDFRTARLATRLEGPFVGDYQIRDSLGLAAVVWSPCGARRALIINSEVRVLNKTSPMNRNVRGVMTIDSINGKVTHIYGLQWRRCPR